MKGHAGGAAAGYNKKRIERWDMHHFHPYPQTVIVQVIIHCSAAASGNVAVGDISGMLLMILLLMLLILQYKKKLPT